MLTASTGGRQHGSEETLSDRKTSLTNVRRWRNNWKYSAN